MNRDSGYIFACVGDLHLRGSRPVGRKDDYYAAQFTKIRAVLEHLRMTRVTHEGNLRPVLLQPGDFFDSAMVPWRVVEDFLRLLNDYPGVTVITVWGQHDMRYRSRHNSPLGVLAADDTVAIAGPEPLMLPLDADRAINVYGASWTDDIPVPDDPGQSNILLAHRMISEAALYPGHEYETPEKFLAQCIDNGYNLVITGDNHQSFYRLLEGHQDDYVLVNPGSLMRMAVDQQGHRPCYYIVSLDGELHVEKIFLSIEQDVWDEQHIASTEANAEIESFLAKVKEMHSGDVEKLDFRRILLDRAQKAGPEVQKFIQGVL